MELVRFPSHGRFSVRSIFVFALAALITALLWVLFIAPPANAAEATWSGDSVLFDTRQYNAVDYSKLQGSHGIPSGAKVYMGPTEAISGSTDKKVFIIYFTSGVDPPTATKAIAVEFTQSPSGDLSNAQNQRDITVVPKGEEGAYSACNVEGVGWIICPISVFLAEGMDTLFNILKSFLEVQPVIVGDSNNELFKAWSIIRNIANIAFVIAFIIIIYSQITSVQVSNYGIKKLLPRLIIAAILVNTSFIIGAIAVDLSNILGVSINQMFTSLRGDIFNIDNNTFGESINWGTVTAAVLGGGTLAYLSAGSLVGMIYVIVPLLAGLALTAVFVLIVLAARQALIIILLIVAPLAFVAYLLPNTEKWYERWQSIFVTMLVFFPAFALVFGGSQLAGQIIIQNAQDNFVLIVLGLAVQVAPLVITPLILKFSGNLLGRIAQIVNNSEKGFLDKANNWKDSRQDMKRQQNLSKENKWYNPGRAALKRMDGNDQLVKRRTAMYRQMADNNFNSSKRGGKIDPLERAAALDKDIIHSHHDEHAEKLKQTKGSILFERGFQAEASKKAAGAAEKRTERLYNTARGNERFAARMGASALYESSYNLENAQDKLGASESNVAAYYNTQRADGTTKLGKSAFSVEAGKLRAEDAQNSYTTRVQKMQATPGTRLSVIAEKAQSSKEHLEAAQGQLQAFFDTQRQDVRSPLNQSAFELERSKSIAEDAKSNFATYIAKERSTVNGSLHDVSIKAETSKQVQQEAEARFTRVIEEYRAGGKKDPVTGATIIDGVTISTAQEALANEMHESAARLSAEKQGAVSAQYVQQERINTLMNENSTDPLTATLLRSAGGIDPNGRIRAQANAISQLDKLQKEALNNSVTLLGDRAENSGVTIVALAKEIYAKQVGKYKDADGNTLPREEQDPTILEAAFEALAQDGAIPTLRDARRDTSAPYIDQDMLTRLFARHSPTMKAKGGFDLQADPSLAGASEDRMNVSVAGTLGDVTASSIASQKAGWWEEVATNMGDIIKSTENYVYSGDPVENEKAKQKKLDALRANYQNVTMALTNPNVLKDIGDRLGPTIEIHKQLHEKFGDQSMAVDYDLALKGQGPKRNR